MMALTRLQGSSANPAMEIKRVLTGDPSDGVQHLCKLSSAKLISAKADIRFETMAVKCAESRKIDLDEGTDQVV